MRRHLPCMSLILIRRDSNPRPIPLVTSLMEGPASIQITFDTYGRLLPKPNDDQQMATTLPLFVGRRTGGPSSFFTEARSAFRASRMAV